LFEQMTLTLAGGKKLVITGKGSSGLVRVDGKAFAKPVISHVELLKAGRMEFS
jgi:putative alpha-1,2-mannosidase